MTHHNRFLCFAVIAAALLLLPGRCVVPAATKSAAARPEGDDDAKQVFYTTSDSTGVADIFAIEVSAGKITTKRIGSTNGGDCISLARSPSTGVLYSMCGPLFGPGPQYLATIDPEFGTARQVGVLVPGLAVMAMTFGPDGTLYAVGDCNPDPSFECNTPASPSDPNFNSLYKVNITTGAFTRVNANFSTGAPQFFMDLAFDRRGRMFGVTSTSNPSTTPAILYRIDPATGKATKVVTLVGSNSVMGLAFGRDGNLYATDFTGGPGLYRIDTETGFETPIAALPFCCSSGLELVSSQED